MMSDALPWEPRSLTELAAWFDRLNELEDAESHPLDITDHLNRLVPILTLLVGDYELAGLDPSDVKAQAYRYKHYARWPNWKRLEIVEEHIGPLGDRLEDAIRLQAMVGESTREPSPEATDHVSDEGDDQQDAIGKLAAAIVEASGRAGEPESEVTPRSSDATNKRESKASGVARDRSRDELLKAALFTHHGYGTPNLNLTPLTAAEMAEAIGLSKSTVSRALRGLGFAGYEHYARVCDGYSELETKLALLDGKLPSRIRTNMIDAIARNQEG